MEEKDSPSGNIFDEASRRLTKKKVIKKKIIKKVKKKKPVGADDIVVWPEGEVTYLESLQYIRSPATIDKEVEDMLNKIHHMRREIENKMDHVYNRSGMTQVQITQYLEDPKNFAPGQWEKIQEDKKELSEKAWEIVGIEHQVQRQKRMKTRKKKRIRRKTIGGRRKNWIPMQ